MASVYKQGNGYTLQIGAGNARRCRRLGKLSRDGANAVELHVGQIEVSKKSAMMLKPSTVAWLAEIDDALHAKLSALDLVTPRETAANLGIAYTVGKLFDLFLERRHDLKPTTRVNYEQAKKKAVAFFGPLSRADSVTVARAKDYRRHLESTLSSSSVSGFVKRMRTVWADALEQGHAKVNPFLKVRAGAQTNDDRLHYVTADAARKVIAQTDDVEWRCLIALGRFGGVRVPSEPVAIRKEDVRWSDDEIVIHSAKTRKQGKPKRRVPIFAELKPFLRAAFDAAPSDQPWLLPSIRPGYNPHTHLLRLIERAGMEPWPRAWQNLRASRETELIAAKIEITTVCRWIGNSPAVAQRHYLMTLPEDKRRAIEGAVTSAALASNAFAQGAPFIGGTNVFSSENAMHDESCMASVDPNGNRRTARKRGSKRSGASRAAKGAALQKTLTPADCRRLARVQRLMGSPRLADRGAP